MMVSFMSTGEMECRRYTLTCSTMCVIPDMYEFSGITNGMYDCPFYVTVIQFEESAAQSAYLRLITATNWQKDRTSLWSIAIRGVRRRQTNYRLISMTCTDAYDAALRIWFRAA